MIGAEDAVWGEAVAAFVVRRGFAARRRRAEAVVQGPSVGLQVPQAGPFHRGSAAGIETSFDRFGNYLSLYWSL